jgi:uncharacterized protein DUF4189
VPEISAPGGTVYGGVYYPPGQLLPPGVPSGGPVPVAPAYEETDDTYGAIGYSPSTGGIRTAWNYGSRAAAEQSIRRAVPADCQLHWGRNVYVALAISPTRWGFGHGASSDAAMQQALAANGDPAAQISALIHTSAGQLYLRQ